MIITILRKPLDGSIVDNTLKHGCGAINVDGIRISTSDSLGGGRLKGPTDMSQTCGGSEWDRPWMNDSSKRDHYANEARGKVEKAERLGRWPANFILIHKEGCELKGTKKVKTSVNNHTSTTSIGGLNAYGGGKERVGTDYADEDGKETVADWACAEGCPVKEIDRQSGILKSGGRSSKYYADTNSDRAVYTWKGKNGVSKELKPSVGGASRFFKQLKKEENQ